MTTDSVTDLEAKASGEGRITHDDARRIWREVDLVTLGLLGETARRRRAGTQVTFVRVLAIEAIGAQLPDVGAAGELRIVGRPSSVEQLRERVAGAVRQAAGRPVRACSAFDLLDLVGQDHLALAAASAELSAAGLYGVAECPLDRFGDIETTTAVIRALRHGGLAVDRLTIDRAGPDARIDLVFAAEDVQQRLGSVRAFSPLPRLDPVDTPSTGYDDVRTVALAAIVCRNIPFIQVEWPLYGPKLAQVALAYGANDVDGIDPVDVPDLGIRRTAGEDILRQIRAVGAEPVERDGRFARRS